MQYTLLNLLPSWGFLLLFVATMSSLAGGIFLLIKYFLPVEAHKQKNDFLHTFIEVTTINFAFLLGLIIVELWKSYDRAKSFAADEANHLALMILDSSPLPSPIQENIVKAIGGYVHNVVNDEWETMKWGHQSELAFHSIVSISKILQSYTPQTAIEKAFYNQVVYNLNQAYEKRRLRLNSLESSLIPALRFVLIFNAFLIIILVSLMSNKKKYVHFLFTMAVSGILFFNVGLALLFEYPFSGTLISTKPFSQGLLAQFNKP